MQKTEKRIYLLSCLIDSSYFFEDSGGKAQDCVRLFLKFAERINLINCEEKEQLMEKLQYCYWSNIQPNEYRELVKLKFKEVFKSDLRNWKGGFK